MGRAVRLHGELELRFGVRLSDDCHRSVAVWAKGVVTETTRDLGQKSQVECRSNVYPLVRRMLMVEKNKCQPSFQEKSSSESS
jgi:hypothetical protein